MAKDFTEGNIQNHPHLTLFCDGGCEPKNPGGITTSAWVFYDDQGKIVAQECRVVADGGDLATNNWGEYCALGFALRWLKDQGWRGDLTVKADSNLLVKQVLGEWRCKAEHLKKARNRIWELLEELDLEKVNEEESGRFFGPDGELNPTQHPCILMWIPREQNEVANELCRKAYRIYQKQKRDDNANSRDRGKGSG